MVLCRRHCAEPDRRGLRGQTALHIWQRARLGALSRSWACPCGVGAAVTGAVAMCSMRKIGASESALTMAFWHHISSLSFGVISLAVSC